MNLPVGSVQAQGLKLEGTDFLQQALELSKQNFIGYLVLTIDGFDGFEEGLLFLKSGECIGAVYDYLKYGKTLYGEEALPAVLNASSAEKGVLDVCSLTAQQLDLVMAFNDRILLPQNKAVKDLSSLKTRSFESSFAKKHLAGLLEAEESKFEILKKFGLGRI